MAQVVIGQENKVFKLKPYPLSSSELLQLVFRSTETLPVCLPSHRSSDLVSLCRRASRASEEPVVGAHVSCNPSKLSRS